MALSSDKSLVLVLGGDENFAQPIGVAIYSALVNLDPEWSVELYILDGGIRLESKRRLERVLANSPRNVNLHWPHIDLEAIDALPVGGWFSTAMYLRLFVPEIVPESWDRAIYIDGDVLVETSLSRLWTKPFDGAAVLAVRDWYTPYLSSSLGTENCKELGLDPKAPYFLSGMLVFNLARWRNERIKDTIIEFLRQHGQLVNYPDQDALNVVLANDWKPLDLRWHVPLKPNTLDAIPESPAKDELRSRHKELYYNPHIYHFSGGEKPWKVESDHSRTRRWFHYWYRYLWRSGWLTKTECLKSVLEFYGRALEPWVRDRSRPLRHWVASRIPAPISKFLTK
jgi:lipopolysaccharide biosynthesis glycosyltransferase